MFVQVIEGKVRDADLLARQSERWIREIKPGVKGYLGSTTGVTPDGHAITIARFESQQAAAKNSESAQQSAWWNETAKAYDGDPTFRESTEVDTLFGGGSNDAGFVQVIQGRLSDPERFRHMMEGPMDTLHEARPDIIGGTIAVDADGFFTQTMAFRTEDAAREGEQKSPPPETQAEMDEMMALMSDVSYHDLHHPWFATAGAH